CRAKPFRLWVLNPPLSPIHLIHGMESKQSQADGKSRRNLRVGRELSDVMDIPVKCAGQNADAERGDVAHCPLRAWHGEEAVSMSDMKELLERIAALRKRLDSSVIPTAAPGAAAVAEKTIRSIEEKVQLGALHSRLIDTAIRGAELNDPTQPAPAPVRLT